jgi:AcrR family transcriptional regulator
MNPKTLRRDAELNRERLLTAARELFSTRGLDVTLDDVAEHAGVGVGTAYRRFADKDELIDALLEDRIDEMVSMAERGIEDPDPWDGLVGYIVGALELQVRDRGLKEVLFAPGRGKKRVAGAKGRLAPAVTKLAARAREAGVVREDFETSDIPMIYLMLGTVVDFSREAEPELYRRYLAILLEGIRAGGRPAELPVPALEIPRFQKAMAAFKSH